MTLAEEWLRSVTPQHVGLGVGEKTDEGVGGVSRSEVEDSAAAGGANMQTYAVRHVNVGVLAAAYAREGLCERDEGTAILAIYGSSCCYIWVLILWARTADCAMLYVCPRTAMCVSSYCYICVLILL